MSEHERIRLLGRIFLTFDIETVTGLHIGGSDTGIEIGGVDNTVVRDALSNEPYIPGSSLRGKMRSLTEKARGLEQNWRINRGWIHACTDKESYTDCTLCHVYGVPADIEFSTPTRLIVRDVYLRDASRSKLEEARTDLPYAEVKTEVAIDRVTSMANPRQTERVPRGVRFGPSELVYSIYDGTRCDPNQDLDGFRMVLQGLQLLEDDYLGGQGSRGYGRVRIANIAVGLKTADAYGQEMVDLTAGPLAGLDELLSASDDIIRTAAERLSVVV